MASLSFTVKKYRVYLGNLRAPDGARHALNAVVRCDGADGELLELRFYPLSVTDPDSNRSDPVDENTPATIFGIISAPISDYVYYLDMLRNEHPCIARVSDSSYLNMLSCNEPAGEGELLLRGST